MASVFRSKIASADCPRLRAESELAVAAAALPDGWMNLNRVDSRLLLLSSEGRGARGGSGAGGGRVGGGITVGIRSIGIKGAMLKELLAEVVEGEGLGLGVADARARGDGDGMRPRGIADVGEDVEGEELLHKKETILCGGTGGLRGERQLGVREEGGEGGEAVAARAEHSKQQLLGGFLGGGEAVEVELEMTEVLERVREDINHAHELLEHVVTKRAHEVGGENREESLVHVVVVDAFVEEGGEERGVVLADEGAKAKAPERKLRTGGIEREEAHFCALTPFRDYVPLVGSRFRGLHRAGC